MAKSEVSADFKSYMNKKHDQFEKARKAESNLVNVPLPIDVEFEAIYIGSKAAVSSAGNPTITFNFSVLGPDEYKGRKVRQMFILNSTEKMSVEDRIAMMFDRLESWGLPREIRTSHEDFATEVLGWFDNHTPEVKGKVKSSNYNQEGKEITWYSSMKQAPTTGMIGAPVSAPETAGPSTSSAPFDPTNLTVGMTVEYNGADYIIEGIEGKFADIKSSKTGRVRSEVDLSELKPKQ